MHGSFVLKQSAESVLSPPSSSSSFISLAQTDSVPTNQAIGSGQRVLKKHINQHRLHGHMKQSNADLPPLKKGDLKQYKHQDKVNFKGRFNAKEGALHKSTVSSPLGAFHSPIDKSFAFRSYDDVNEKARLPIHLAQ
jgi:hypothetical protein